MARKKTDNIEVKSFEDIRSVLVDTLNKINNKSITASEGKTICYILQTLLSVQKNINETDDGGQDSIRELCLLVKQARNEREDS